MKMGDFKANCLSKDSNKVSYVENNNLYIYDFQKQASILLKKDLDKEDPSAGNFGDQEGKYFCKIKFPVKGGFDLSIMNTEDKSTKVIELGTLFEIINFELSPNIKVHDGNVYVLIASEKEKGIYIIDSNKKRQDVIVLHGKNDLISNYDLVDNGKSIVFAGTYNNDSGVFLYNIEKKTMKKLMSGGTDKEGQWSPSYNLSPMQDKILFDEPSQDNGSRFITNVYAAQLIENQISKKIKFRENQGEMAAVIYFNANWINDTKFMIGRYLKDKEKLGMYAVQIFETTNKN